MTDHPGSRPAGGGLHFGALPAGYPLRQYRFQSVLGVGGFGITYRAVDERLRRPVAVKEYLPNAFAIRVGGTEVRPRSPTEQDMFSWGLKRFLDEARTLAALNEVPHIVHVYDFLEANGTGYMVMELIDGEALDKVLARVGKVPPQAVMPLLPALLRGMEAVHRAGYLHRDIKPGNVLIRRSGEPVLVDFGAARMSLGQRTQVMTSIYSPGYAPPEQYALGEEAGRQGAWSDIYAMAATFYHVITGAAPPDAMRRLVKDNYVPLVQRAAGQFAPGFLAAVDAALSLSSERRPQSIAAWNQMLFGDSRAPPPAQAGAVAAPPSYRGPAPVTTGAVAAGGTPSWMPVESPRAAPPVAAPPSRGAMSARAGRAGRRRLWIVGGALAAVLLVVAGAWSWRCVLDDSCSGKGRDDQACAAELDGIRKEIQRVLATLPDQRSPVFDARLGCQGELTQVKAELQRLKTLAATRSTVPPISPKPPVVEPKPPVVEPRPPKQ
jgi:serine/threonine protein kinase